MKVTFSSGLEVRLRGLRNDDFARLRTVAEEQGVSAAFTTLFDACTEEVLTPGPFSPVNEQGAPDWVRAYCGDRLEAGLWIKMASYPDGHEHHMELRCPSCPPRLAAFPHVVDLRPIEAGGDLLYFPIPEEALAQHMAGIPFETTIGGSVVQHRLITGKDEQEVESLLTDRKLRTDDVTMAQAWRRIVGVEGVHKNDQLRWLEALPVNQWEELEAAFDAVEGGVELAFEATCPRNHTFEAAVPFGVRLFRPQTKLLAQRAERRRLAVRKRTERRGASTG